MHKKLPDHLKSITFLFVDDMTFYHSLLQQTLVNLGHTGKILFANNVKEAISVVSDTYQSGQKIDFIISDYLLGDISGIAFAKKVRAHPVLANLPMIMISTDDNSQNVIEAINVGVDNYVFKPLDPNVLLEKIIFSWNKRNPKVS